jgi:hypothetical protein
MLIANGWTDDLFPADEAIRLYNKIRTERPFAPISLLFGDFGHQRAQGKAADHQLMEDAQVAWLDYYVKHTGPAPFQGVETLTQTCPFSQPSGGPYFADTWATVSPGEVRLTSAAPQTIAPDAGSQAIDDTFEPVHGDGACGQSPADDQPGTATYRMAPVPSGGFTMLGSPTVIADVSASAGSEIAARLFDVAPDNTQKLVARGLWRPAAGSATRVYQLHPNGWTFGEGHVPKLELLPKDSPYGRISDVQQPITVSNLDLRLPVRDQPGSAGGVVQQPLAKVLPLGYALARDFVPTYVRPRGATPINVSLVPAYKACLAPTEVHAPPLSFGSCPPVQESDYLTFGSPDANGMAAQSLGSVRMRVRAGDASTPADEADVTVTVSLTDVRMNTSLADYAGELRARTGIRITDRAGVGAGSEPTTTQDFTLAVAVPCAVTTDVGIGSTCSVDTTWDAVTPGTVPEGRRTIWQLGKVEVYDGGADGLASTGPNTTLARQGIFAP